MYNGRCGAHFRHWRSPIQPCGDLSGVGCEPYLIGYALHLNHAALRHLPYARLVFLDLTGGEQAVIRMARTGVAKVGKAKNLRLQVLSEGVQKLGQRWVIRTSFRSRPQAMNIAHRGKVVLDDGIQLFSHSCPEFINQIPTQTCGKRRRKSTDPTCEVPDPLAYRVADCETACRRSTASLR
jgi:hypothetical protein